MFLSEPITTTSEADITTTPFAMDEITTVTEEVQFDDAEDAIEEATTESAEISSISQSLSEAVGSISSTISSLFDIGDDINDSNETDGSTLFTLEGNPKYESYPF